MGHDCQTVSGTARGMMGRAQVIERTVHGNDVVWGAGMSARLRPAGWLLTSCFAGSDPRADGHAVAEI